MHVSVTVFMLFLSTAVLAENSNHAAKLGVTHDRGISIRTSAETLCIGWGRNFFKCLEELPTTQEYIARGKLIQYMRDTRHQLYSGDYTLRWCPSKLPRWILLGLASEIERQDYYQLVEVEKSCLVIVAKHEVKETDDDVWPDL